MEWSEERLGESVGSILVLNRSVMQTIFNIVA